MKTADVIAFELGMGMEVEHHLPIETMTVEQLEFMIEFETFHHCASEEQLRKHYDETLALYIKGRYVSNMFPTMGMVKGVVWGSVHRIRNKCDELNKYLDRLRDVAQENFGSALSIELYNLKRDASTQIEENRAHWDTIKWDRLSSEQYEAKMEKLHLEAHNMNVIHDAEIAKAKLLAQYNLSELRTILEVAQQIPQHDIIQRVELLEEQQSNEDA